MPPLKEKKKTPQVSDENKVCTEDGYKILDEC